MNTQILKKIIGIVLVALGLQTSFIQATIPTRKIIIKINQLYFYQEALKI